MKSDDVTGRVRTYEAIVKGHNIPQPGVPESFKVLMKELQALCLDIQVLDKDGNEIELKDDDDDDYIHGFRDVENERYSSSDDEIVSAGYAIEDADIPDDEEADDEEEEDDDFDFSPDDEEPEDVFSEEDE